MCERERERDRERERERAAHVQSHGDPLSLSAVAASHGFIECDCSSIVVHTTAGTSQTDQSKNKTRQWQDIGGIIDLHPVASSHVTAVENNAKAAF